MEFLDLVLTREERQRERKALKTKGCKYIYMYVCMYVRMYVYTYVFKDIIKY